jgi:hypothetical protein
VASVGEFFHQVVEMLPWRQESDKMAAHTEVEDTVLPAIGRNAVPAGVQTSQEPTQTSESSESTGFPTGPQTPDAGTE